MTHISRSRLNERVWQRVFNLFVGALAEANNKTEAEIFVTGFLTKTERIMLSKRFAVFFLLEKGVLPVEIKELLKISYATVGRIDLWRQTLNKKQRAFVAKILRKKLMGEFLTDIVKGIYYGPIPPGGTDWKRWRRGKYAWEKEQKKPLR